MSEIDLIPHSYRVQIWKIRILKLFAVVFVILIVTSGVAYGALVYVKNETNDEISKLLKVKEITARQRETLRLLSVEENRLDYQWALLSGLRSAVSPEDLLLAIDTAIEDIEIWFTSIRFQRAEVEIDDKNEVHTGYFIIVTPGEEKESWAIGTKMLISGEVLNHSTLSTFVEKLLDQPEILDADVIETSTSEKNKNSIIQFSLAITVNLDEKLS